ncbi:MAG: nucleoside triphosphate pyrophosphohydrolase [Anaerolineae bacterium]|nr:nucleoside triphosphate pyrophosphohydrolase [Anaerolineae bacterium]
MIEKLLTAFGIQINPGLFISNADALYRLHVPPFPPTLDALIVDISQVEKLRKILSANYSGSTEVLASYQGHIVKYLLQDLPEKTFEAIYIPRQKEVSFAEDFQEVIAHLRAPDGCPWDREQTHESLRSFLLEEVYEFLDAVDENNAWEMAEELGDVMLQLFLHAQIATECDEFRLHDIFTLISSKMRRRHPHVFADVNVNGDVGTVLTNWQEIKAAERKENGSDTKKGALDGVSKGLPALLQAQHYQQRAILNGFHWDDEAGAFGKVREEIEEVLLAETTKDLAEEYGDLLFALVSAISYCGLEAEQVLREANQKFYQRYTRMESLLEETGKKLFNMNEQEKVALWESAKR